LYYCITRLSDTYNKSDHRGSNIWSPRRDMATDAWPALLGAQDRQCPQQAMPKSQRSKAKRALQEIWMAEAKKDALLAFDAFIETWTSSTTGQPSV
jgi:hypothetical protein